MANKEVKYNIRLGLDNSDFNKSITDAYDKLQRLSKEGLRAGHTNSLGVNMTDFVEDSKLAQKYIKILQKDANTLANAMQRSYSIKLDTINLEKFNAELSKSNTDLKTIYKNFSKFGEAGKAAFTEATAGLFSFEKAVKRAETPMTKLFQTFKNSIKWEISSSVINKVTGVISEAYGYVKNLDSSLNNIRIVTGKSADEMDRFAKTANQAAQKLGASTVDYTNAALIYYQQGLGDVEAQKRAEITTKVSNITGLSGEDASQYVTAVLNSYRVGTDQAEESMDKLAAVAARTASDLEELSQGMSKTASAAANMGVSQDQLAASIATIVSVTKEEAGSVGNALKTVYTRMADIQVGAENAEASLGRISGKMAKVGINVLDNTGHLRNMGEIIEEVGHKWKGLSREEQVYAAKTMAGTRQYSKLISLFDNFDMYEDALQTSQNSLGELNKENDIYLESVEAHLQKMSTAAEGVFDSLLDAGSIDSVADVFAGGLKIVENFVDAIGGGKSVLLLLGSVALRVFREQIGLGVVDLSRKFTSMTKPIDTAIEEIKILDSTLDGVDDQTVEDIAKDWIKVGDAIKYANQQEKELLEKSYEKLKKNRIDAAKTLGESTKSDLIANKFVMGRKSVETSYYGPDSKSGVTKGLQNRIDLLLGGNRVEGSLNNTLAKANGAFNRGISNLNSRNDIGGAKDYLNQLNSHVNEGGLANFSTSELNNISPDFGKYLKSFRSKLTKLKNFLEKSEREGTVEKDKAKIEKALKDLQNAHEEIVKREQENIEELANQEISGLGEESKNASGNLAASEENFNAEIAAVKEKQTAAAKSGAFGDIMAISTSAISIANVFSTLGDDNLSTWDKISQITMSIGMSAPLMLNSFKDLKTNLETLNENGYLVKVKDNLKFFKEGSKGEEWFSGVKKGFDKAGKSVQEGAGKLVAKLKGLGKAGKAAGEATSEGLAAAAGEANVAGTAISGLGLTTVAWGAIAVAAIAAIGATIYLVATRYKRAEENAKKFTESAKNSYESANEAAKSLKETLDQLDEKHTALTKMQKGTNEFTNALREANEESRNLIDAYDLIRGKDWIWKNGEIIITQEGKEKAQNQVDTAADNLKSIYNNAIIQEEVIKLANRVDTRSKAIEDDWIDKGNNTKYYSSLIHGLSATAGSSENLNKLEALYEGMQRAVDTYIEGGDDYKSTELYSKLDKDTKELADKYANMTGKERQVIEDELKSIGQDVAAIRDRRNQEGIDRYTRELIEKGYSEEDARFLANQQYKQGNSKTKTAEEIYEDIYSKVGGVAGGQKQKFAKISNQEDIEDALAMYNASNPNKEINIDDYIDRSGNNKVGAGRIYAEKVLGLKSGQYTVSSDKNNITVIDSTTGQEFKEDYAELSKKIALQAVNDAAKNAEDALDEESANNLLQIKNKLKKSSNSQYGSLGGLLLQGLENNGTYNVNELNFSPEQIKSLQNLLQNPSLTEKEFLKQAGMTADEATKLFGDNWFEDIRDKLSYAINNVDTSVLRDNLIKAAKSGAESAGEVLKGVADGSITPENIQSNEIFQTLLTQIESLKSQVPELASYYEILNNTQMAGTQGYLNALEEVQDIMNNIELSNMIGSFDDLMDKLEESKNETKDFKDTLEELVNKQYEINLTVRTNAEEKVDSLLNRFTQLTDIASKVGKSYKIAATDVEDLANAFPGILEGATYAADGTTTLSKEVAQAVMGDTSNVLKAKAEATIQELENQAVVYDAQAQLYDEMSKIALDASKNEAKSTEAKTNILKKLEMVQANNKKLVSEDAVKKDKEVSTSANNNAKATSEAWASAANSMASNFANAANQMVTAQKNAARGKKTSAKKISSTFEWANVKDTVVSEVAELEDANPNDIDWSSLATEFKANADSSRVLASTLRDKKGIIRANAAAAFTSASNAYTGKGNEKSKGSKDKQDKKDPIKYEADVFHDLDIEIKQVERDLKRLQEREKKLRGAALIENINAQFQKLRQQTAEYTDKLDVALQKVSLLQNKIVGYGAKINSDGTIANYDQLMNNITGQYNAEISRYNKLSAENQKTDANKERLEKAKENYDEQKKIIDEYEKLNNETIPEIMDKIEETLTKEVEIKIKKFEIPITLSVDVTESRKNFNEFKKKVIDEIKDDDILGTTEYITKDIMAYLDNELGSVPNRINAINTVMAEIKKMESGGHSDIYSAYDFATNTWIDDTAKAYEHLKEYQEGIMTDMETIVDLQENAYQNVLKAIDGIKTAYDELKSVYDLMNDMYEHQKKMTSLIYGEEAYDRIGLYLEKQTQNNQKTAMIAKDSLMYWNRALDEAKIQLASGEITQEEFDKIKANFTEASQTAVSSMETWMESAQEQFNNTIKAIRKNLDDTLTNGLGLNWVSDQLERQFDDTFLDDINSLYEIQKFENSISKALYDNRSNVYAQEQLNKLKSQELEMLKKKEYLTQYDVDRAQKILDITLKQIALQEAQQNKSKMRLRRDANGNYSYQFVSDEQAIADAKQELADAENNLYNFDKEAYQNNLKAGVELYREFTDKCEAIQSDMTLSAEEKEKELAEVKDWYNKQYQGLLYNNAAIRSNLENSAYSEYASLMNKSKQDWYNMTESQKNNFINNLVPAVNGGAQKMMDKIASEGGLSAVTRDAFAKMDIAAKNYKATEEAIALQNEEIYNIVMSQTPDLVNASQKKINKTKEELDQVKALKVAIDSLANSYKAAADASVTSAKNMLEELAKVEKKAAAVTTALGKIETAARNAVAAVSSVNNKNTNPGGTSSTPSAEVSTTKMSSNPVKHIHKSDITKYEREGNSMYQNSYCSADGTRTYHIKVSDIKYDDIVLQPKKHHWSLVIGRSGYCFVGTGLSTGAVYYNTGKKGEEGIAAAQEKMNEFYQNGYEGPLWGSTFDTGGYTGSWGKEGKLATLHEKELVLNKTDTVNILSAVDTIRSVTKNLGAAALEKISNLFNSITNNSITNRIVNKNKNVESQFLDQTVYIDATFPNVRNSREIEDALNNLANTASQRVLKNKK